MRFLIPEGARKIPPSVKQLSRGDTLLVLNSGYVQYLDHMGGDEDVVAAARTSTGRGFVSWEPYERCEKCGRTGSPLTGDCVAPQLAHDRKAFPRGDAGILEYLYVNRHMTPFEMCVGKFIVKAPIIFFRQLHRHRAASYNEMSARYTQLPNDFYVPRTDEVKRQSKSNKQGSEGELSPSVVEGFIEDVQREQQAAYEAYENNIADGIAPEMARINLPVSINSVCVVQMNLRMLLHMLGLRDDSHAQGLTQEVCRGIAEFARVLWPRTYALYEEHTKYAKLFSRSELVMLNKMLAEPDADKVGDRDLYDAMMKLVAKVKSGELPK